MPKNRPPSATKPKGMVKNQDLKKVENTQVMNAGGIHSTNFSNPWDEVNAMQSSATSFYSEKPMNKQQQESLKKATAKPFDMRKSATSFKKHVEDVGSSKENMKNEDDLISEISMPEIDWAERKKIENALKQREKDREELDLDSTFK